MGENFDFGGAGEEIEGAPPAESGTEVWERRRSEVATVNRYLYQQSQQFVSMMLEAGDLESLLEILLGNMPRHFSFRVAELWLLDSEETLAGLITGAERWGKSLQFLYDIYPIQELYDLEPDIEIFDATDSRMFEVLKSEQGVEYAMLMPLMDAGRLIGSLHLGWQDESVDMGDAEDALLAHLASVISRCFRNMVQQQQISRLTLVDPLTQIGNLRGFERDIAREISRAHRAETPFTLMMLEIDDYDDLAEHYGRRRSQFVVKKVAERLASNLRATDMLARLDRPRFALLIPGSGELLAGEIAERMRADIEDFAIDDGRGAVLQVCVSIGLVTWEPQQYPAIDMPQLARQMESVGVKALDKAVSRGGNGVAASRLSTMIL
jgi:diguanylate cyclase (GGDEF)-like protein